MCTSRIRMFSDGAFTFFFHPPLPYTTNNAPAASTAMRWSPTPSRRSFPTPNPNPYPPPSSISPPLVFPLPFPPLLYTTVLIFLVFSTAPPLKEDEQDDAPPPPPPFSSCSTPADYTNTNNHNAHDCLIEFVDDFSALDGQVGKRLHDMIPIPVTNSLLLIPHLLFTHSSFKYSCQNINPLMITLLLPLLLLDATCWLPFPSFSYCSMFQKLTGTFLLLMKPFQITKDSFTGNKLPSTVFLTLPIQL